MAFFLTSSGAREPFRLTALIISLALPLLTSLPAVVVRLFTTPDDQAFGYDQWQSETPLQVDRHEFQDFNPLAHRLMDTSDKGNENMGVLVNPVTELNWISRLSAVQLPEDENGSGRLIISGQENCAKR